MSKDRANPMIYEDILPLAICAVNELYYGIDSIAVVYILLDFCNVELWS